MQPVFDKLYLHSQALYDELDRLTEPREDLPPDQATE
jgi:hypothetical protein